MIFQVFLLKKICFSVFLLNGIADKDSRFNSGVQFHLMVPLSFPFRIQIWGTVGFFLSGFSFTKTHRTAGEGRGPSFIPLYHFHPLTNTHTFVFRPLVSTRLLLDKIYHLIELLFDWLMMWCWFSIVSLFRFCYNYLTWETRG